MIETGLSPATSQKVNLVNIKALGWALLMSKYLSLSVTVDKLVLFSVYQDLLSRKFDGHSKLGIAYHVYDIIGAEIVKRYE